MDFLNLNETVRTSIRIAQGIAREYGNEEYTPAHLLLAILHKEIGLQQFFNALEVDSAYLQEWAEVRIEECPKVAAVSEILPNIKISDVLEQADNVRLKWGLLEISAICVLSALTRPCVGFSVDELKSFPLKEKDIDELFSLNDANKTMGMGTNQSIDDISSKSAIAKYCIDKSMQVKESKIYPIINRDKELRMMMEILGRRSKPNILIIGDAGVGKTALVDGLVYNIVDNQVPSYLSGCVIFELDTGALIAGATYKGEIEDRLKSIIKELERIDGAILFIDEIHTLLDPKQGNNGAANILKPELSKGAITVIGATTIDEYRKVIEVDHAFNRRFEILKVSEPDFECAVQILKSSIERYENYHRIEIDATALPECVAMAKRYIKERKLPDAAIDLLDRTMSAVKMINDTAEKDILDFAKQLSQIEDKNILDYEKFDELRQLNLSIHTKLSPILLSFITGQLNINDFDKPQQLIDYINDSLQVLSMNARHKIKKVSAHHIATMIANTTGIPVGKIESNEKDKLINMESILRQRVVGQDSALRVLSDAIIESRSGMNREGQPIGSFFFLGPTGTGKTELAKALAETLFDDEKAMIRFDMSEFKEEHSAALLYGAPPGYVGYEEGGLLVNKIRQQPYSVVLFDEIEKAHASVYDIFLQIMDEGKIHDRLGKEGDFSNAIILFTSNVGSDWVTSQINAGKIPTKPQLMEIMSNYFRPEFLGRLTEIVPFSPIDEDMLLRIFDIQLSNVSTILNKKEIGFSISDDAKRILSHQGFTPKYGARQIAGTIRNAIRRPLSRMIIGEQLTKGNNVTITADANGQIVWNTTI